ncbi:NUDIX hydrolase [Desulfofarcimen acetoxidans DSM 771]|uniref:NUDIX hydrolase n=1 Tax=Desulfofarcimen acetoxidans (strain ATCC 49208 / DSM 771 / KCTC 5769 / VKM B-1644 / 5575) TaxID=485916 RepID=C8VWX5_DESAS|nr:NUDIX hydrolase [Desulfofarcimen acetoxidans]ACV62551.1 NUDIX hydrolase [Desulfofarcimen acetoxidans DSM 771]
MSDLAEKTLESKVVYQGKVLSLRLDEVALPNGSTSKREVVEHAGAVTVIAITNDQKVLLVRQFRYSVGEVMLELPAGGLKRGEEPLICAKRELKEETGWEAEEWRELPSFFTTPGFTNEKMYLFLARNLTYTGQDLDEDEFIQVISVPLQNTLDMVRRGEIRDAKSIVGILLAESYK